MKVPNVMLATYTYKPALQRGRKQWVNSGEITDVASVQNVFIEIV